MKPKSRRKAARRGKEENKSLSVWLAVGVVLVVAVMTVYLISARPPPEPGPSRELTLDISPKTIVLAGNDAPDFTLPIITEGGLSEERLSLHSFKGKVVVLEFTVSSCEPCGRMAVEMAGLHHSYSDEDVMFISVAAPLGGADAESTARFIKEHRTSWTYVFDSSNSVFMTYGAKVAPTIFVIHTTGVVIARYDGWTSYEVLAGVLDSLLKK